MTQQFAHSFTYRTYIPPSVWADFFVCKRRFYYQANHVFPYHNPDQAGFHHQFDDQEWWQREVRLPSGSRIDLWITAEKVGIEYKTLAPDFSHAVQVWEMQDEVMQLGIARAQFQLWYDPHFEKEVAQFAKTMKWDWEKNELDYLALAVQPPDLEQLYELEQTKAFIHEHIQNKDLFLPEKATNKKHCTQCRFYEYCHS